MTPAYERLPERDGAGSHLDARIRTSLGRGVELAVRALVAPTLLAARWLPARERPTGDAVPVARASLGLGFKMLLDEVFFLTEVLSAPTASLADRHRFRAEVAEALALYAERGWLDEPLGYHPTPPPAEPIEVRRAAARGLAFQHLRFDSGYAPHPGEPGRARWLGYAANRTAHAWVLEHAGPPRPWLVCVPGYRMGHPLVDFTGFPAVWLHHRLGLNVAIPVLPLHGPRRIGLRSGDGFLSGDYIDTVHMQAQAVWDVRRLVGWLRARGARTIGAYGVSLGAYTTALLAALEADLACVIAGISVTCYVSAVRWNLPPFLVALAERIGPPWAEIERLCRVISPLALPPRVAPERRYLFGALGDRLASPYDTTALWQHWGRPRLVWYAGGHVSFTWEAEVRSLLREALAASGMRAGSR